jgi:hypothetical protein
MLYGVLHNQISARVSSEYFTIGHRTLIQSTSPTLMGIAWGINSTWWVGLILGVLLASAGRLGRWEKRTARSFVRPVLILFAACGAASLLSGFAGYRLVSSGTVPFLPEMSRVIPLERQPFYIAALWMHTASYTAAAMGGLILTVRVAAGRLAGRKP